MKQSHSLIAILFSILYGSHLYGIDSTKIYSPSLVILGTVQDAGSPHPGCKKTCCKYLYSDPDPNRMVVSIGIIDPQENTTLLFEATPDLPRQMKYLSRISSKPEVETPTGIFLTHAHIGHYTGLMYLGREGLNTKSVRVFVMPKMKSFLENNGPWDQLIKLKNIELFELENEKSQNYSDNIKITPFLVPHRDEYSETVGFLIQGPRKKAVFIPDIDKWQKWDNRILTMLKDVDYAFIDGTFYNENEINNRNISEIPHPFVIESMELMKHLPDSEKNKVHFIHLNHTNPLLDNTSPEFNNVLENNFNVSQIYHVFEI